MLEPMVIAGGFISGQEHAYDEYGICRRCGGTQSDVMQGKRDWECAAAENVTSMLSFKWRRANKRDIKD